MQTVTQTPTTINQPNAGPQIKQKFRGCWKCGSGKWGIR